MLRLALIGDLHLSQRSPRYGHTLEILESVIGDDGAGEIDLYVLLGDLVEGAPTPREYDDLMDAVAWMGEIATHGVALVLGNHEHPEALCVFDDWLKTMSAWNTIRMLDLDEARILLVPYPRRGRPPFDDLQDDGTIAGSMHAAADRIGEAVNTEIEDLHRRNDPRPLIVLGHFSIEGMKTRDADFELHSASEVVVPQAAFAGAALTAVGHIHRAQVVTPTIIGVGSLIRHSFAEADDPKSYTLVTVDRGRVTYEQRAVEARPMVTTVVQWPLSVDAARDLDALYEALKLDDFGAEVKITVLLPEDQVATFTPSVFDGLRERASHFVLEKVVLSAERVRAPAIAQSTRLEDQLSAWLGATETTLEPGRVERVLGKVGEVRK